MSTPTGFHAVDDHPDTATLVAALDLQAEFPAVQRLRATALDTLTLQPGDHVLDAGCGTGDMTGQLATKVAPRGRVVGIDISETMLGEARRRHADCSPPLELRYGTVTDLDLDSGSFDAVYCERVLQHLAEPQRAISELVRVTRTGGRVAVIDTDWGMHAIAGADLSLTRRITACWAEHLPNGWSGRSLPAQLIDNGLLPDPVVVADTIITTKPASPTMEPFTTMAAAAERDGDLTADQAACWLRELRESAARGRLFWAVTMFLITATRR
jgi:SAM-dependent methyltransferase